MHIIIYLVTQANVFHDNNWFLSEQWYDHFRKRFISTFSVEAFTDGSIEEEIKKLDLVSKESDKIEFDDT